MFDAPAYRVLATIALALATTSCRHDTPVGTDATDAAAAAASTAPVTARDEGSGEPAATPLVLTPPPRPPAVDDGSGSHIPDGRLRMSPRLEPGAIYHRTATLVRESELVLDDGARISRAHQRDDIALTWRLEVLEGSRWSLRSFRATFDDVTIGGGDLPLDGTLAFDDEPKPGEIWTCELSTDDDWACADQDGASRRLPAWLPVQFARIMPGDTVEAGARWTRRTGMAALFGLGADGRATARVTLGAPWQSERGRFVEAGIELDGELSVPTFDRPALLTVEGTGALTWDIPASYVLAFDARWVARGEGVHVAGERRWAWRRAVRYTLRTTSERIR